METRLYLEFDAYEEVKEYDNPYPYQETEEAIIKLDGFRIDDMPSEEFKNYILTKLTEQL